MSISECDVVDLLLSGSDPLFDVSTAAQQLGLTSAGVRYLIRRNRIAATFSAGRWFIPAEEIAAHRAARQAAGKL
ncbi:MULTISPECIES: helix-turn-helix domain-containing protein [Actinomycetes]|uniref:helix-turn-helix domain-containing protein n=1 Tax=Actinomycetes TaxID=1760 RepID=UPI000ABE907E|nr:MULTISPECIES: helix-turn-helix domain-containing protein [Actinomycetes]